MHDLQFLFYFGFYPTLRLVCLIMVEFFTREKLPYAGWWMHLARPRRGSATVHAVAAAAAANERSSAAERRRRYNAVMSRVIAPTQATSSIHVDVCHLGM